MHVAPDELAAELRADADAGSAQEAQARVNAEIAAAVDQARAAPGVAVATGSYDVWRVTEPKPAWHASQSLSLHSRDGTALLALLGGLQAKSLALGNLSWRLSPDLADRTRADATRQALAALRGRAVAAADVLGLRFDSFREIRIEAARPGPVMPRAMMMAKAAAPEPVAASEDLDVTATIEAEAVLQPKP